MANFGKRGETQNGILERTKTSPKGQVALVALANGINAASKAIFLAVATYLTTGEVFETFILLVVIIDAGAIVLDLGGNAGVIVTARSIRLERRQAYYRRAQLFKLAYLLVAALFMQSVLGALPALLMIAVCVFEFQNTLLQSSYRFLAQVARQSAGLVIRLFGLVPLYLYQADSALMLALFYSPQLILSLVFILAGFFDAQQPRPLYSNAFRIGFDENREIYRVGRSSLLMQIAILVLRRGDIAFVSYFLGPGVAAKVGLLFTFAQFLPMLSNAVSRVLLPYMLDNVGLYDRVRKDRRRIIGISVALAGLIAVPMTALYVLIFQDDKLVIWSVAWLVFLAISMNTIFQPISTTMYRKRAIGRLAQIHLEQLVVQGAFSLSLIPFLDIYGVAISLVIVRLYGLWRLNRAVGQLEEGAS
ncbi:lipopolysaccharide biosynthesis protein [Sulfitobacter sp. 1A12057]|uniref:lipopolysaccharide biosynthesis protein n=1 Tax=Sulfitobacter sp. 1A12057 TaxID=3368567 RepID=UPI0037474B4A